MNDARAGSYTRKRRLAKRIAAPGYIARVRTGRGITPGNLSRYAVSRYQGYGKYGAEVKRVDYGFYQNYANPYVVDATLPTYLQISTSGLVQMVNVCQQGVGISQRVGNKICMKSLRLRFVIQPTGNAGGQFGENLRFMVIYDRNPNGMYPASNLILSQISQANTVIAGTYLDNLNPNLLDRFVTMLDKRVYLPALDTANGVASTYLTTPTVMDSFIIDEFVKLRDLETIYSATSSPMVVANVQVGALYLLAMGDIAAGSEQWCLKGNTRLTYHDN